MWIIHSIVILSVAAAFSVSSFAFAAPEEVRATYDENAPDSVGEWRFPKLYYNLNTVAGIEHIALKGFDPTTFFEDESPQKGLRQIRVEYGDVVYLFVNEENRQRFLTEPNSFEPAYGGHYIKRFEKAGVYDLVTVNERMPGMNGGISFLGDDIDFRIFVLEPAFQVAVEPTTFLVRNGRLYLFNDEASKQQFEGNAEFARRELDLVWNEFTWERHKDYVSCGFHAMGQLLVCDDGQFIHK